MSDAALTVPPELVQRYSTAAPRYTSYPTAVDWKSDVPCGDYPAHLQRSAARGAPCSVYVHIPFCEERCLFCGCNVFITHDHGRAQPYLDHLALELQAVGRAQGRRRRVTQYHWGGGTPTWLGEAEIRRLHDLFLGAFDLDPGAEAAIEADPRVTTGGQLRLLAAIGFNRLSVGVQDFDPKVQAAVNRIQSFAETEQVIETARATGFHSVNVDLIYGLPYQTLDGFLRTVDQVLTLRPERIALFHYAHVPWLKKHQTALELEHAPPSEEKVVIFTRAIATFTAAGYEYLGLDHFALPDDELARARRDRTLQRSFMGYTTHAGSDLVGLGVSAIGEVDGAFFQNLPVLAEWQDRVAAAGVGVQKSHRLTADDLLRRDVIMALMCHGTVVKAGIEARHGIAFDATFARELEELVPLARDGLLDLGPDALAVTRLGQVFLRNIAVVFDRCYRERHSRAGGPDRTFSRTF